MSYSLPSLPSVGTGLPAARLDAGTGQYAHHYPAGLNTSACYSKHHAGRAAWASKDTHGKPRCPSCGRRVGGLLLTSAK